MIKFDEKKPMHKNAADLHEMLECKSKDSDRKISINKAKFYLGSLKRVPQHLQTSTLHDLEELGFIKMNKFDIEVLII